MGYQFGSTWADKEVSDAFFHANQDALIEASTAWWERLFRPLLYWGRRAQARLEVAAVDGLGDDAFWAGKGEPPAKNAPGQDIVTLDLVQTHWTPDYTPKKEVSA